MATSGFALTGRFLAGIAAASLLAGVSLDVAADEPFDFAGNTDMGVLRLQLGQAVTEDGLHNPLPSGRFVYETKGQPGRGTEGADWDQLPGQAISLSGKCNFNLATTPAYIAQPTAAFPLGSASLGLGPDSIGVQDGPKGVACYRITESKGEWVQFQIGPELKNLGARSFYGLQIDLEVKQNAVFELQVYRGGAASGAPWILQTGSSVTSGSSPIPGSRVFACSAKSDSGPDSGAGDNCTWKIPALGDGFRLTARFGEGSLEGGGDWGAAAYANNTIIYLTDAEIGSLGCDQPSGATLDPATGTIGDGFNDAECSVTRVDASYGGPTTCTTNIGYVFRTLAGSSEGCALIKDEGEQLAAVLEILFPPEPWSALQAAPLTEVSFPNPAYSPDSGLPKDIAFTPERCEGTLEKDANGDDYEFGGVSPDPTIKEVLDDPVTYDLIPGGKVEYACVLENDEDYVGKDPDGVELIQVRQRILFWGDINFARNVE